MALSPQGCVLALIPPEIHGPMCRPMTVSISKFLRPLWCANHTSNFSNQSHCLLLNRVSNVLCDVVRRYPTYSYLSFIAMFSYCDLDFPVPLNPFLRGNSGYKFLRGRYFFVSRSSFLLYTPLLFINYFHSLQGSRWARLFLPLPLSSPSLFVNSLPLPGTAGFILPLILMGVSSAWENFLFGLRIHPLFFNPLYFFNPINETNASVSTRAIVTKPPITASQESSFSSVNTLVLLLLWHRFSAHPVMGAGSNNSLLSFWRASPRSSLSTRYTWLGPLQFVSPMSLGTASSQQNQHLRVGLFAAKRPTWSHAEHLIPIFSYGPPFLLFLGRPVSVSLFLLFGPGFFSL